MIVWDLSSGNRVSQLSKTSEGNEGGQLCALSCDSTEKMCLTAFLSGEIKVSVVAKKLRLCPVHIITLLFL